jgi:RNA recognition motif-containing protein
MEGSTKSEHREGSSSSSSAPIMEVPPNETLYVNNLNEKVKKEELRKSLYALFSQYGTVLDVIALKTLKMRGQAFVVFRDVPSATNALRQMNNYLFYDKMMKVSYAKTKSDIIAKMRGTWTPREKRPREEKPKDTAAAASAAAKKQRQPRKKKEEKEPSKEVGAVAPAAAAGAPAGAAPAPGEPAVAPLPQPKPQPPNKILFVQNLPEQTTELMLNMLFQQFPGFKESKLVPGKKGIAFVEFGNELEAAVAMNGLQHFKITPTNLMVISFAMK